MSALFARRKRLILVLVGLTVCIVSFEAWARWVTVIPLHEPIALSREGQIDKELQIRRNCIHSLELVLSAGSRSRDEAASLVGGLWMSRARNKDDTGVKVPVKWSLIDPDGKIVSSGERDTARWMAVNATEFRRSVERFRHLTRARYHLNATVLRDIPEMDGMTAHLRIGCENEKRSSGWQDDLLLFGHLIEILFAMPLIAVLSAILLGLELRRLLLRNKRYSKSNV